MRTVFLAAALWMAVTASGQDALLKDLHATLKTLHSQSAQADIHLPGARPELTIAKHQLRDWIESQLGSAKDDDSAKALSIQLNEALKRVEVRDPKDAQNLLGALGEVRLRMESGYLIASTAVGILCQYDESAYAYKQVSGHWQRVWESEQNDYSPKKYAPQSVVAVHVWHSFRDGDEHRPLYILTLGNAWGCASSWHDVYYRVWRIDSSGSKLLIDRTEWAWLRTNTFIVGSIGRDSRDDNAPVDVLIEFTESSIAANVREAVRHFLIEGDQVRRVDPVALSPRDFVDEWLTRPWNEIATWSTSPTLRQRQRKLHVDFVAGHFGLTMRCQTPDLWQVTARIASAPEAELHFLVRWRPPYHFTMVNVSDKPFARCDQEDPEADQWRTLFNDQEWRW
jgi:hypothetical protein